MDELQIPFDSTISVLIAHILVKKDLIPEKKKFYLVAREQKNIQQCVWEVSEELVANCRRIFSNVYGRIPENEKSSVFINIIETVLVN